MDSFDTNRLKAVLCGAALDPALWKATTDTIADVTRSHGALLIPLRGSLPFISASDNMQEATDAYVREGWVERDLRFRGTRKVIEEGLATEADVASEQEIKTSPYYQEFIARFGLKGWIGLRIGSGANIWCLAIQRSVKQDDFSTAELETLRRMAPELDVVAEVAHAFSTVQGTTALAAFDAAKRAALLIDRDGKVCRVNRSAECLFDDDIGIRAGRLHCPCAASNHLLNVGLKRIVWDRKTSSVPPISMMRRGQGPVVAYVMAVPGTHSVAASSHAIVVLVDLNAENGPSIATLKAVYGLTSAEARLAASLARGLSLEDHSLRQRVSKETVRYQLKGIFDKTGVRRQAQLVARLARLPDV